MFKSSSLEIPYRLETIEDIEQARDANLLGIGPDYYRLLVLARKTKLHYPNAFSHANKKVAKQFIKIVEEKLEHVNVPSHQVAHLSFIDQYPLIEECLPWIQEVTRHESIFQFLQTLPLNLQKDCMVNPFPESPSMMYKAMFCIRRYLRRDMIVYLKASKTSYFSLLQLKQLLVALSLGEGRNEDVLNALKACLSGGADMALYQNAMAELLFSRLPKTINGLTVKNTNDLSKKLHSKMTRLNFSNRQIINLTGYLQPHISLEELPKTLDRIAGVAMRMNMSQETKDRLVNYIGSMKRNIERAPSIYRILFLNRELATCQKMYKPVRLMQSSASLQERTTRVYVRPVTLEFYPSKDYLDILKGRISSRDCTSDSDLAEKQLLTPGFFNIRIFNDKDWIGNIYMLDCEDHKSLLIDRIQIPRNLKVLYHHFFDNVRDVLIEMFADVQYQYILMPIAISNHKTIQKLFNEYRKCLAKKTMRFDYLHNMFFESLRGIRSYYVLHQK